MIFSKNFDNSSSMKTGCYKLTLKKKIYVALRVHSVNKNNSLKTKHRCFEIMIE